MAIFDDCHSSIRRIRLGDCVDQASFKYIIYYCLANRNISQCKYVDTNFVNVTCKVDKNRQK